MAWLNNVTVAPDELVVEIFVGSGGNKGTSDDFPNNVY